MSIAHRSLRPLLLLVAACGDGGDGEASGAPDAAPDDAAVAVTCDEGTLADTLAARPGVTSASETECGNYVFQPARCFAIEMTQPVDHAQEGGATFPQRLFLVHRGCDRPMLVADWGYANDAFFDTELSSLYGTNDLWIEHRYQGASMPAPADWRWDALTIENGAGDMHRVIESFRALYQGRWVSTGASKGGITAVYHAYLHPDDLDGTIPFVAPASRARVDPAYQTFLEEELPAECAAAVRDVQVAALTTRREMMLERLTPHAFEGDEARSLEFLTQALDWGFWQGWGAAYCDQVPAADATDDAFWGFYLDFTYLQFAQPGPAEEMRSYGALSYEWLTEQGFALQINDQVAPFLEDPIALATMEDRFRGGFPDVILPAYDGSLTAAVRDWVRDEAEDMLLIDGQFDPWRGGEMDAPTRPTSGRFVVPAGSHAAQIAALGEEDRAAALALATGYFGVEPDLTLERAAARAGAAHQRLLHRQRMLELASPLRESLRRARR